VYQQKSGVNMFRLAGRPDTGEFLPPARRFAPKFAPKFAPEMAYSCDYSRPSGDRRSPPLLAPSTNKTIAKQHQRQSTEPDGLAKKKGNFKHPIYSDGFLLTPPSYSRKFQKRPSLC
jgi:hypothetical protein